MLVIAWFDDYRKAMILDWMVDDPNLLSELRDEEVIAILSERRKSIVRVAVSPSASPGSPQRTLGSPGNPRRTLRSPGSPKRSPLGGEERALGVISPSFHG